MCSSTGKKTIPGRPDIATAKVIISPAPGFCTQNSERAGIFMVKRKDGRWHVNPAKTAAFRHLLQHRHPVDKITSPLGFKNLF